MGSPIIDNDSYPRWTKAWLERLPDVDAQIINCCRDARDSTEETITQCCTKVQRFFENQPLDDRTRSEFEAFNSDPHRLRMKVENRISQLTTDGKVDLTRTMRGSV